MRDSVCRILAILWFFSGSLYASSPRCSFSQLVVPQGVMAKSGEPVTLQVSPVAGALDYDVQVVGNWSVTEGGTWELRGPIARGSVRPAAGAAPKITWTFYATADFEQTVYV